MGTQLSLPPWSGGGPQGYDVKREDDGTILLAAWDGFEDAELRMTKDEARALAAALLAEADAA